MSMVPIIALLILELLSSSEGKLILKHFPSGPAYDVVRYNGKSLIACEVESDRPFKLLWFKNGKPVDFNKRPPWPYKYSDNSGISLVGLPYLRDASVGTYECRATNGYDTPVSYKVTFSHVKSKDIKSGFPKITKSTKNLSPPETKSFGENITLHCNAIGLGENEIFWTWYYVPLHKTYIDIYKHKDFKSEGFDYSISKNKTTLKIFNLKKVYGSYISCFIANKVGMVEVVKYYMESYPARVPLRAELKVKETTARNITLSMLPNIKESTMNPNVSLTHAIVDYQRQTQAVPLNKIHVKLTGKPPWFYSIQNLLPYTKYEVRISFENKYGIGAPFLWQVVTTHQAPITDPIRNLQNIPTSNQSFTLSWEEPLRINGPFSHYIIYWTRKTTLKKWNKVFLTERKHPTFMFDWRVKHVSLEDVVAPVVYWKVVLVCGQFTKTSETKVFRVSPGAPGFIANLQVKTIDSRTIQVSWNVTNKPGNGIVGYQVLYNRQDIPALEKDWKRYDVSNPNILTARVAGLSPNRVYDVKVFPKSHTMYGVAVDTVSTKTLTDVPTAPPANVHGTAKSSETIEVYWSPPPAEHQNGAIINYRIYYTRVIGRKPHVATVDKDERMLFLQGLSKHKKYTIWVVAVNIMGTSPPSPMFGIYMIEEVPRGAPHSVRAQALNDTTIAVTWLPPDLSLQNGRIIGYKITYVDNLTRKSETEKIINSANAQDEIISRNILANHKYRIQVSAFTSIGVGAKSFPILIHTLQKLPNSPDMQLIMDAKTNFVRIQWWPCVDNIVQYKIEYGKTLRKFDKLVNVKVKLLAADVRKLTFEDLDPGVYYSIKISGRLKNVDTDAASDIWTAAHIKWIKTSDRAPTGSPLFFEGITKSSSAIKLKWEQPAPWKRNGHIVGYIIRYKTGKEKVWTEVKYDLIDNEDTIIYIMMHLKANTRYHLKVRAVTNFGSGPDSPEIQVATNKEVLPFVEKIRVMEVETNTAFISWDEPKRKKELANITLVYTINCTAHKTYRDADGKSRIMLSRKSNTILARKFQLYDLIPATRYSVLVLIYLSFGVGDSKVVHFMTRPDAPKNIEPPIMEKTNITNYIPLKLHAASEINGPIHHYLVFVINLKNVSTMSPLIHSNQFGVVRQRRSVNNITDLPEYHIVALLKRTELPTSFKLGDGYKYGNYENFKLNKGDYYIVFVRAFVKMRPNEFVHNDSGFSTPMLYAPIDIPTTVPVLQTNLSRKPQQTVGGISVTLIIAVIVVVVTIATVIFIIVLLYRRKRRRDNESDSLLSSTKKRSLFCTHKSRESAFLSNMMLTMTTHTPIPKETLIYHVEFLKANNGVKFIEEFESIEPKETNASEVSLLPQNKMKNRYPNVLACDKTRVKLNCDDMLSSDYINANYIDGYCKERAYIATQGPMKTTIHDFWRLCWEQNVQIIIMMTKLEERGRNKCEQYWPSSGGEIYDTVKVELKDILTLSNYSIRTFQVSSTINGDSRTVKHFQYLLWPDPGVPINPGPILNFIRRIRSLDFPKSGPIVVHCSAGVGRSACFIAIDAMLEQIKYDSMIDIYGFVTAMRSQRNFMVQTDEQYLFVYNVLVEAIEHGNTEIRSSELFNEYKHLKEQFSNGKESILEAQFKTLGSSVNYPSELMSTATALSEVNESKNRSKAVVPFDLNRVCLQLLRSHLGSDYINATFIDGFHDRNKFIATQGPTVDTVADFWRMIVEQNVSVVVMLTNVEEKNKEQCIQYWPSAKSMRHHYYVIDRVQENCHENFIVREFKITDARDGLTRNIYHYQFINWLSGRVPKSPEGVLELIGLVEKSYNRFENNGPIVVHSSTGAGRAGVFISLSIALESLRTEHAVDIYQIVKGLRYERPYMVKTLEQYDFCYQVTCHFLRNFDFVV